MAKARMVSRSISTSEKVNRDLPKCLRENGINVFKGILFYTWIHPHSDDFGRMDATPYWLRLEIVPGLQFTESEIEIILKCLHDTNLIILYENKGKKCFQIVDFDKHQSGLSKRTKSNFPEPPRISGNFTEFPSEGKGRELN
jgi:hypothetical protein